MPLPKAAAATLLLTVAGCEHRESLYGPLLEAVECTPELGTSVETFRTLLLDHTDGVIHEIREMKHEPGEPKWDVPECSENELKETIEITPTECGIRTKYLVPYHEDDENVEVMGIGGSGRIILNTEGPTFLAAHECNMWLADLGIDISDPNQFKAIQGLEKACNFSCDKEGKDCEYSYAPNTFLGDICDSLDSNNHSRCGLFISTYASVQGHEYGHEAIELSGHDVESHYLGSGTDAVQALGIAFGRLILESIGTDRDNAN
ncbi:hypothetical protein KKC94_04810 [Patescibacteria group bacterium]|nr:hypothetical protein [Patescibacteria group bacterium]